MKNDLRDRLAKLLKSMPTVCTLSIDCDKCEYESDMNCVTQSQADHLITNSVVPVVRCKDCKYFITDVFNRTMCNRLFTMFEMADSDYCSYGERSADNGKM